VTHGSTESHMAMLTYHSFSVPFILRNTPPTPLLPGQHLMTTWRPNW
jgi:hypothetical protein